MNTDNIPDSIKLLGATSPTVLTIFGWPVEQWTYVASAIVSAMFIIEKMPILIKRIKEFVEWIYKLKGWKSDAAKSKKP